MHNGYMTQTLKITKDRKTANLVTPNGKQASIANAFSLPAGREYACPDATDYCEVICYAGKLEKIFKGFRANVMHNFEALQNLSVDDMVALISESVTAFERTCDRRNAPKLFRIHADGDFFSTEYAQAWSIVIAKFTNVQFWVYTRVAYAAVMLHKANHDNLALYFSSDPKNIAIATMLKRVYGILIAHVDETFEQGKSAIEWRAVKCPENSGALPLISEKGSACFVCGLCINGRNDVLFSRTKR